jgi:hypothetical protein
VAAKVLYIYRSADGAFTCIQKRSYGIELSVFYHQNYRGPPEHLRQYGVVESVGKVFGLIAVMHTHLGAGAAMVQPYFFCASDHSTEPGWGTV